MVKWLTFLKNGAFKLLCHSQKILLLEYIFQTKKLNVDLEDYIYTIYNGMFSNFEPNLFK